MSVQEKQCLPCEGKTIALSVADENRLLKDVIGWELDTSNTHKIVKKFTFKSYTATIEFVNKVAHIAEEEYHHPVIQIHYRFAIIELSTHSVHGLSENDFIVAAKINSLL